MTHAHVNRFNMNYADIIKEIFLFIGIFSTLLFDYNTASNFCGGVLSSIHVHSLNLDTILKVTEIGVGIVTFAYISIRIYNRFRKKKEN